MSEQTSTAIVPSGQTIDWLWSDEGCAWRVELHDGKYWTVVLEWVTDRTYTHDADWVTFTWEFYADTIDEALTDAAEWCQRLAPWRRCAACDGRGEWNGNRCDECVGSGLESGS